MLTLLRLPFDCVLGGVPPLPSRPSPSDESVARVVACAPARASLPLSALNGSPPAHCRVASRLHVQPEARRQTMSREETCEARIDRELAGRVRDLGLLWDFQCAGKDDPELGSLSDYGLCFDFVPVGTFDDQAEAYFRYQISWGGPSDEFRFFVNPDLTCHRVEYWFLDWFDGASRVCTGDAGTLMHTIWDWFRESGLPRQAMKEAQD